METKDDIVIYKEENGKISINARFQQEIIWLTQNQIAELFQTSKSNISEHLSHIFAEGELDKTSSIRNFRTVQKEGNREVTRNIEFYNLDAITEEKGQYCQPDKGTLLNIRNWCFFSLEKLSSLHDFYDLLENKQEYDKFKKEVKEDLNNYKSIYGDYIDKEIKELNDYIFSL